LFRPTLRGPAHQKEPDGADQGDRQEPGHEERLQPRRLLDEARELDAVLAKLLDEIRLVDSGQPCRHDPLGCLAFLLALGLQLGQDVRVTDEDLAHLPVADVVHERAHGHGPGGGLSFDDLLDDQQTREGQQQVDAGELELTLLVIVHREPRSGQTPLT
jgi:hypothetical protein